MTKEQDRIDLEIAAVRYLGARINKMHPTPDPQTMLFLYRRGYLQRLGGGHDRVTDDGEDYYNSAITRPEIRAHVQLWKNEVATGMDEEGDKTTIQNPAVPAAEKPQLVIPDILRHFRESTKAKMQVAQELGISIDALLNFASEGRLRVCNRGESHLGLFDRDNRQSTGWAYNCRRCRKGGE